MPPSQKLPSSSSADVLNPSIKPNSLAVVWAGFLNSLNPSLTFKTSNSAPVLTSLSLVVWIAFIPMSQAINFLSKS